MDDAFPDGQARRWSRVLPEVNAATVALTALLTRLARQHDLFHSKVLRRFKITHAEYVVLATLRIMDPPRRSPTQLGRIVCQTSAGITKTVDRLERAGLIARSPAPGDRRSLFVELTAAGVAMAEHLVRIEMAAHEALLQPLRAGQRRQVRESLGLLIHLFESQPAVTADDDDGVSGKASTPRRAGAAAAQR
jgi:DNA-binding MarR family transcriptional regulator